MTVDQKTIDLIVRDELKGTKFDDLPEGAKSRVERISQDPDRLARLKERKERKNNS